MALLGKTEQMEQEVMSDHETEQMEQEVMSDHETGPSMTDCMHPDVCMQSDTPADKASVVHMMDKEPITSL